MIHINEIQKKRKLSDEIKRKCAFFALKEAKIDAGLYKNERRGYNIHGISDKRLQSDRYFRPAHMQRAAKAMIQISKSW